MTQLIINGIYLPETSRDKYQCYPGELSVNVQMITWSYDYMGNALWRQLAAVLRSGKAFPVVYLPDDSDTMATGTFLVESMTQPTYAFSRNGVGLWHNVGFTLREVTPHD